MKTAFAFIVALAAGLSTAAAQTGSSTRPETSTSNTSPAKSYPPKRTTPTKAESQQSTKTQKSTLETEDRTSPTGTMSKSSERILKETRPAAVGQGSPTGSTNQESIDKNSKAPVRKANPPASKTGGSGTTTY